MVWCKNAATHRAATSEGEGIAGEAEFLQARHRHELDGFQARQTVLPDVEPSEASQLLEDRRLDRRDEVVREIQLLQKRHTGEPLIPQLRDVVIRQTEPLQVRQAVERVVGDRPDAAVLHIQGHQARAVPRKRSLGDTLYPRPEHHHVAYVQRRAVDHDGVQSYVEACQALARSCDMKRELVISSGIFAAIRGMDSWRDEVRTRRKT